MMIVSARRGYTPLFIQGVESLYRATKALVLLNFQRGTRLTVVKSGASSFTAACRLHASPIRISTVVGKGRLTWAWSLSHMGAALIGAGVVGSGGVVRVVGSATACTTHVQRSNTVESISHKMAQRGGVDHGKGGRGVEFDELLVHKHFLRGQSFAAIYVVLSGDAYHCDERWREKEGQSSDFGKKSSTSRYSSTTIYGISELGKSCLGKSHKNFNFDFGVT